MNTSSLHSSVCGRIYLQTRQSIYDTLSTFLLFQLIMAIVFIAIPLLLTIATSDFDLVKAFQGFAIIYANGRLLLFYTGGLSLFSMVWINRVVHQVHPTAYTQIPSSTLEKLCSMALVILCYTLITCLAVLLLTVLLQLLMPLDATFIPVDFRGLSLAQLCQGLYNTLPGMLFLVFLAALCMMSFRNVFVGFAVLGVILVLVFWGVTIYILQTAHIYYETPEEFLRGWETAMLVQRIVFLLLDLGLVAGLYYRLHTLQIK
jgi:membrane protein